MKRAKSFKSLVADVEELLAELKDNQGPEVQELRDRVEESIDAAKRAIGEQGSNASARVRRYAASVDHYINGYPRLAFLSGALIFGVVGYWAGTMGRGRDS
jgi:ElaB/YqjD/DUF883 family membrane-anchored ribosome-binding protein